MATHSLHHFLSKNAPRMSEATATYSAAACESAESSLSPKLQALIRLAVALSLPSEVLAAQSLAQVKTVANDQEIAEAVLAAVHLRAGAATAYGRLVFKYTEPSSEQPRPDREYMKNLMRGNPELFQVWQKFMGGHEAASILSKKEEELIAVACATVLRCVYCLETHGKQARAAGATDRDLADTIHLSICGSADATMADFEAWKTRSGVGG